VIKVNLLRNRGENTSAGKTANTEIDYEASYDSGSDESSSGKDIILKIILVLIGTGGLMAYESYNIDDLRSQLSVVNQEKTALASELQQKQPIAIKAKELQKQIQDIEARIKAIKDLSKIRLREIKAVDYLQNVIPEKVWLTSLDFKNDSLNIKGGALSDDQLNRFMDSMEGKSYFRNVILLKAVEQKSKEGTIKIFEIGSTLTNSE
jgi:Tfp pilus assembly protein PilN